MQGNKRERNREKNREIPVSISQCLVQKRKGQAEVVGLLLIVLIVAMVILFSLVIFLEENDSIRDRYDRESMAQHMVGAILQTSTCGRNTDIGRLLVDCAKDPGNGGTSMYLCNPTGLRSCAHARQIIEQLLGSTLDQWGYTYEFKVISPSGNELITHSNGDTSSATGGKPYNSPLPVQGYGHMDVMLCMGSCPEMS